MSEIPFSRDYTPNAVEELRRTKASTAHTHNAADIVAGPRVAAVGTTTLIAGIATVLTAAASATGVVFVTTQNPSAFVGLQVVQNVVPGVSFDIVSAGVGDTSVVGWMIVEP